MPQVRLDHVALTLFGQPSPFSLGGMLPAAVLSSPVEVLSNVGLDVPDGERIALGGAAGSGRSSLLRLLAGRLTPTAGTCRVDGRVVAILDVESALDLDATGRQNLERLAPERADEAAELSGLGELLDVPLRWASPGMRWRVGFAAASAQAGEVLLVDECLHQADLAFRSVALARLRRLMERTRLAIVAEPTLFATCSRVVELVGGRLRCPRGRKAA